MKQVILISILVLSSISFGQNTARFSQINFAQGVNNPAAIAHDGLIMADLIFRNQWLGVEGAPTTIAFNGQYEINEDHAVGLNIYHDRIGVHNTTSFSAQYAYRAHLDNARSVSFGLSLGADNVVNDLAASQTSIIGDPVFSTSYSSLFFNGSFGIYYNAPKFYIGASIPQLFQNTLNIPTFYSKNRYDHTKKIKSEFGFLPWVGIFHDCGLSPTAASRECASAPRRVSCQDRCAPSGLAPVRSGLAC